MILDIPSIVLFITFLCNLTIGVYVISQGPRKKLNLIFGTLILQIALWNFVNFISFTFLDPAIVTFVVQFSLFTVLFIPGTFFYFVYNFIDQKFTKSNFLLIVLPILGMLPFLFTKYNVFGFDGVARGQNFIPGPLYLVYTIYFICLVGYSLIKLVVFYKTTKNSIKAYQTQYIFLGMLITSAIGITTNAILPLLNFKINNGLQNSYGTAVSIVFSFTAAYAITRYRLFDIKFIIRKNFIEITSHFMAVLLAVVIAYGTRIALHSEIAFVIILIINLIILEKLVKYICWRYNISQDLHLAVPDILKFCADTQKALQSLFDQIQNHFRTTYHIQTVIFCVFDYREKYYRSLFSERELNFNEHHTLATLAKYTISILSIDKLNSNFYEIPDNDKISLKSFMKKYYFSYALVLSVKNQVYGFIFIPQEEINNSNFVVGQQTIDMINFAKYCGRSLQEMLNYDALIQMS